MYLDGRFLKMNRYCALALLACALALAVPACSGGGNPTTPAATGTELTDASVPRDAGSASNRVLWGLWHIAVDPANGTIEVVPLRSAMLGVNVTQFMQPPLTPTHMITFALDSSASDFQTGLFVLDVTLRHPFPGLERYRGFDVRGIFMSDEDSSLPGDAILTYAGDAAGHMLNPDGFTRWWNSTEFTQPGIFGFTPGGLAPPNYPTAILNPYKYFCDDLEAETPLSDVTLEDRGTFGIAPGVNSRRYEIQFVMSGDKPVFDFNYAVDASWHDLGKDATSWEVEDFPLSANCHEAWWIELDTSESTMYYIDPTTNGGELISEITVHDWQATESGGSVVDEVAGINLHSTLLSTNIVSIFAAGATLVSEDTGVATWRVTTVSDDLDMTHDGDYEMWVEVLSSDPDNYAPQIPGGEDYPHADGPLAAYILGHALVGNLIPQNAPTVLEVIPDWGYEGQTLETVQIIGTDFIEGGLSIEFSNGTYSIPVSNESLVSDTEITVDLDLAGAEIDLYDVTVQVDNLSGPGSLEGTLENGFEVVEPLDYYGWPFLGRNSMSNSLTDVDGPQTANLIYSASCTQATAPETLLIGVDPDDPDDRLVYIGFYSSTSKDFSAYHASDGSVKWSVSPSSPYSFYRLMAVAPPNVPCPNNESGTVYVWAYPPGHAAAEKIIALSAVDGSTLWEYTAPTYSWLMLERFGLVNGDGDFIFCHAPGSTRMMRCLDHNDGSVKWEISTGFQQTPDPVLSPDGNTVYVNAGSSNTLRAYDMTSTPPTQKWSIYLGSYCPAEMQSSPIVASDGSIYEIGRTNRLVKITDNGTSATVEWATGSAGSQSAWVQLAEGPDGSIYSLVPSSLYISTLYRYDPSDGAVLNQSSSFVVQYNHGLAIADDGKVYVGGRNSGVYCFNADCSLAWYYLVSGCRFTDAALDDDGSLFVADTTGGNLYRFQ